MTTKEQVIALRWKFKVTELHEKLQVSRRTYYRILEGKPQRPVIAAMVDRVYREAFPDLRDSYVGGRVEIMKNG